MADRNFPSDRSHGGSARGDARTDTSQTREDPLAALARLINQSGPGSDARRGVGRAQASAPVSILPTPRTQWTDAEERYEEVDDGVIESYDAPQLAEPYPSYPREFAAAEQASAEDQLSESPPRFASPDDDVGAYGEDEEQELRALRANRHSAMPGSDDADADYFYPGRDHAQPEPHDAEDDDSENKHRRGGSILIAAVLGLAVLGTAGAFAYRAMFGSSALPTLPPIIKASDEPNKIVPSSSAAQAGANGQADAVSGGPGNGDRLVSREEQPVDVPKPVNPTPRVVSTIPVFPDPGARLQGAQAAAGLAPGLPPPAALPSGNPSAFASAGPEVAPPQGQPTPPAAAVPVPTPSPKKIHTVVVHSDEAGADQAAAPSAPARASSPAAAQHAATAPAPKPNAAPPRPASGNGPLEIAPQPGDLANPSRTRTALAHPPASTGTPEAASAEPASAPAAGGGYAVQVTSQRSEAEAEAAYRSLRAKYPDQLGRHEPIVRRADLGAKGIYYRALVGPFASAEQAQALCASLKAAGGSCIVQKD